MATNILKFIHRLQQLAQESPDKAAVIEGSQVVSRKSLLELAYKVSAFVKERVSGCPAFIPIALPNGADYIAVELGIWMSGNATVHLGDEFPEVRKQYIVNDCNAPFVFDAGMVNEAQKCEPLFSIDEREGAQACVMFYTSGSTGNPKGVLHSDQSFMEAIERAAKVSSWNENDIFGNIAPFYFIAIGNVYEMLYIGGVVDIVPHNVRIDIDALQHYLKEHNITTTFISPSLFHTLNVEETNLRCIRLGGERVSMIASRNCNIYNFYGQTELAGAPISFFIDKAYDNTPVGKIHPDLQAIIVDENDNEVAFGDEGELCIKEITAPRYFGDEDKTRLLCRNGMLHTGDVFRQLPSGDLLYVNRKDWMVKINGQRVEPGEVEVVLNKIKGIRQSAVKGFSDEKNHRQYLCAFYVSDDDVTETFIRSELEKALPPYMIPMYYVKLNELPQNANGKLDYKGLKSPVGGIKRVPYKSPTNDVESLLCKFMGDVLSIENIGLDEDFIALGGDSIRIMKLQQKFNLQKPPHIATVLTNTLINQGKTPRKIAELLEASREYQFEILPVYPLNDMQMFYFFISSRFPDQALSNLPMLYKLDDSVDMERLACAIEKVVINHDAFSIHLGLEKMDGFVKWMEQKGLKRISFIVKLSLCMLGLVKQRVVKDFSYKQIVEDMDDKEFTGNLHALFVKPFAMLDQNLFRIRLIKTQSAKYLFFDVSHVIFDGDSMAVFIEDLERAYQKQELQKEIWTLPHAVMAEKSFQKSNANQQAFNWYKEHLKGVPQNIFPRPNKSNGDVVIRQRVYPLNLSIAELQQFARQMGCSVNVFTTVGFALLLSCYSGSRQVPLSLAYNGREDYRTERTIGMLSHGIILNTAIEENSFVEDYINGIKENILSGMNNCFISIRKLVQSGAKLQNCMPFLYQGEKQSSPLIGGAIAKNVQIPIEMKEGMPMVAHFTIMDGSAELMLFYHEEMYSEEYLQKFVYNYGEILRRITKVKYVKDLIAQCDV